jgi:hypothetical protein
LQKRLQSCDQRLLQGSDGSSILKRQSSTPLTRIDSPGMEGYVFQTLSRFGFPVLPGQNFVHVKMCDRACLAVQKLVWSQGVSHQLLLQLLRAKCWTRSLHQEQIESREHLVSLWNIHSSCLDRGFALCSNSESHGKCRMTIHLERCGRTGPGSLFQFEPGLEKVTNPTKCQLACPRFIHCGCRHVRYTAPD